MSINLDRHLTRISTKSILLLSLLICSVTAAHSKSDVPTNVGVPTVQKTNSIDSVESPTSKDTHKVRPYHASQGPDLMSLRMEKNPTSPQLTVENVQKNVATVLSTLENEHNLQKTSEANGNIPNDTEANGNIPNDTEADGNIPNDRHELPKELKSETDCSNRSLQKNLLDIKGLKDSPIHFRTDPKFLSFTLDSSRLESGVRTMKLTDPKLISLTKHLSPAYLRIGGIAADRLLFRRHPAESVPKGNPDVTYFTGDDFLALHKFARQTNTDLIFDLNVLQRTEHPCQAGDGQIKNNRKTAQPKNRKSQSENLEDREIVKRDAISKSVDELSLEENGLFPNNNEKTDERNDFEKIGFEDSNKIVEPGSKQDRGRAECGISREESNGKEAESGWNSSNAADLLKFCEEQGLFNHWQLGNEPNAYTHKFNMTVSPEQLADDFQTLKRLLKQPSFHEGALIIGPDVSRPLVAENSTTENAPPQMTPVEYLDKFLSNGGTDVLDAVGFHQYYLNGNASVDDYYSPDTFDRLHYQISVVKSVVEKNYENHVQTPPIWLSETGSTVAGGTEGITDSFVASFLWIDKLGLAAQMGVSVVLRQSLMFGHYGMIDVETLRPNPDWWLSVLYKKLVDPRVLLAPPHPDETLRLYVQCSPSNDVTVFGIHIGDSEKELSSNANCEMNYYAVRNVGDDPKQLVLNDNTHLVLNADGSLPELVPIRYHIHPNDSVPIPPHSVVFMEIQSDEDHGCRRNQLVP